jgi:long-chain fatty acid transport protein
MTDNLDLGLWGRWVDKIRTSSATLVTRLQVYEGAEEAPICAPSGDMMADSACSGGVETFYDNELEKFEYAIPPPEVRAGIRFHVPRTAAATVGWEVRDPLHDDLFDIELDGSYTANGVADEIIVRFKERFPGRGAAVIPVGNLPPIADQATGFKDSIGVRLGGQYNIVQDKLGLMVGTWYESESQDADLLSVSPPGPERGGFGGGIVFRQDFLDITFGYQYHWSSGLDNKGHGLRRAVSGSSNEPGGFSIHDEPLDLPAVDRREFRSYHIVNGGNITQHAHAFALGGVVRY